MQILQKIESVMILFVALKKANRMKIQAHNIDGKVKQTLK